MKFSITLLICCIFVTLTAVQICHAQISQQDYVNAHNAARVLKGVGNLVWNTTLMTYAQNYANQRIFDCALVNSGGPFGENIVKGNPMTGTGAIQTWMSEEPYYTYSTNTCATGKVCGHYTQVVWSNSVRFGCARVQCANGLYFVICSYDPPGNVAGEKPYTLSLGGVTLLDNFT